MIGCDCDNLHHLRYLEPKIEKKAGEYRGYLEFRVEVETEGEVIFEHALAEKCEELNELGRDYYSCFSELLRKRLIYIKNKRGKIVSKFRADFVSVFYLLLGKSPRYRFYCGECGEEIKPIRFRN